MRALALPVVAALVFLRDPSLFESPRFWAEVFPSSDERFFACSLVERSVREPAISDDENETDSLAQLPAGGPLADEQHEMLERQQAVRGAIGMLSERCRDLITMLFYEREEASYAEIARRMVMPVPSVGPTRARCLEKLRRALEGKV